MTPNRVAVDIHNLSFSCPRGQKSEIKVLAAVLPLKVLEEGPSLPLPTLIDPGIPWLVTTSLQSLPLSPHGLSFGFHSSFKDTNHCI